MRSLHVRQVAARHVRYYLLGGDTAALSELYARLCYAFLVSIIFAGEGKAALAETLTRS